MNSNLTKISRNMRAACFVLLISTTALADKFKKIEICNENDDTKCVVLAYKDNKLVVKNTDHTVATLDIDSANFTSVKSDSFNVNKGGSLNFSNGSIYYEDTYPNSGLQFKNFSWIYFDSKTVNWVYFGRVQIAPSQGRIYMDNMDLCTEGKPCASRTRIGGAYWAN